MFNNSINKAICYGLYVIGCLFLIAGVFFLFKSIFGDYGYGEKALRWYHLAFSIGGFGWGFVLLLLSKLSVYIDRVMPEAPEEDSDGDEYLGE